MAWDNILPFLGSIFWFTGFIFWLIAIRSTIKTRQILILQLGEVLSLCQAYENLIADEKKDNECPK